MYIIAFHGSPRTDGNSHVLLKEALKGIDPSKHRVKIYTLNEMNIKPCQNCGGCDTTGVCIIDDDMREIYASIREAERIILASPIFFFNLSAQTKIMIDRCQAFWCEKFLLKRPIPGGPHGRKGLLLLVGGMKKDSEIEYSDATAKSFFRSISVPEHKTFGYLGIDEKGAILRYPAALQEAAQAVNNLLM